MQSVICPSCEQPIKTGSKFCHYCGSPIEKVSSMTQLDRGKQKLIGIIVAILIASIIGELFTLPSTVQRSGIVQFVVSTVIRIGITILLLFLLYKGYWWAKWLIAALLLGVSLIFCSLLVSFLTRPMAPTFLLVLIAQTLLYGIAGLSLLRSEDVAVFLQEQEQRRK